VEARPGSGGLPARRDAERLGGAAGREGLIEPALERREVIAGVDPRLSRCLFPLLPASRLRFCRKAISLPRQVSVSSSSGEPL
jgi:hypothetical protein